MEIMKLIPTGKDYLWGGTRLREEYGKKIDLTPLAETWECSVHPDGPSFVANGTYKGKTLSEVLKAHPKYLGTKVENGELPVLVKFIDVLSNKMTIKEMFILSSMLYAIGIGLNAGVTFSEYLSSSVSTGIALYFKAFVTTRNGLFQSFAFITTGMACGLATKQGSRLLISRHKFKSTAFKLVSYNDVSSLKSSTFVTAITLFIAKFACSFSGIGGGI